MRYHLMLLFCWLSVAAFAQQHHERLAALDIQHYTFHLSLFDDTDRIEGLARVQFRVKKPVRSIHLDLFAERPDGKGMRVHAVQLGDTRLDFRQSEDSLLVSLPYEAVPGQDYELQMAYAGIPADGLIIGWTKFGGRAFFGDNWPNRARHWLPTVDHPSDKATVEFIVEAGGQYQVVATGRKLKETILPNGRRRTHWGTQVPISTKVMVVGVAEFAITQAGVAGGIPVSSWVFPQNREAGFADYAEAVEVLAWFQEMIAPYPFEKLANVQSRTRYGGMENASNIFYYENSVTGKKEQTGLIAHEIAHQWFGNSASEADWHHVWLSEGFATYFTLLYYEHLYDRDFLEFLLQSDRTEIIRFAQKNPDQPIVDTRITDYMQLLSVNNYEKAGWVLHMLREKLGTAVFREGIRTYYERYQLSNAYTADFQKVMEEVSGQDLATFFQQWIYEPGIPELEVVWSQEGEQVVVSITQQAATSHQLDLLIHAEDKSGQQLGAVLLPLGPGKTQATFPVTGKVTRLQLDPRTQLLFKGKLRKL